MGLIRFVMRIFKLVFPCVPRLRQNERTDLSVIAETPPQLVTSRARAAPASAALSNVSSTHTERSPLLEEGHVESSARLIREKELERQLEEARKYSRMLEDELACLQDAVRQSVETLETPEARSLQTGGMRAPNTVSPVPMVFALSPHLQQHTPTTRDPYRDTPFGGTPESQQSDSSLDASTVASPSIHWVRHATGPVMQMDKKGQRSPLMEVANTPRLFNNTIQQKSDREALRTPLPVPFVLSASGGVHENQTPVVVGMPNTSSKYKESASVRVHATPFEARVDRTLREAEDFRYLRNRATTPSNQ
eukprot:CAMPEP_0117650408 /NCGR_PEP_ID=MMETSP0804-20121206/1523_1 /TAXON_ID=1074897 /ORGANISM="Tetraselmis astigmatica, Strain CCMP880" /LENGTH=306 /DNA_ID=CAMNT_0005456277 /DNA_START=191 /DNA_END=1111 /DNA_ORIENTATION=+